MEFRRRLQVACELMMIQRRRKKKSPIFDITRSALEVLKESADGFPPLKSTVGGVIEIWDIHRVHIYYLSIKCYTHTHSPQPEGEDV